MTDKNSIWLKKRMKIIFSLKYLSFILIFLSLGMASHKVQAQISVAILPLKGNDLKKQEITYLLRSQLGNFAGISLIADKTIVNKIRKVHEKAQSLGSNFHDISKLKVAEFLVFGSFLDGKVHLKTVEVNTSKEIYNKKMDISSDYKYSIKNAAKEIYNSITLHLSNLEREIPEEAKPYFQLAQNFVKSLGSEKEFVKYITYYKVDDFKNPSLDSESDREKVKSFLRVVRPRLIRAKIYFLGIKFEQSTAKLTILAKKFGKKTKHRLDIIELSDGSLAVRDYNPLE